MAEEKNPPRPSDNKMTIEDIQKNKDQMSPEDQARLEGSYGVQEPREVADDEEE